MDNQIKSKSPREQILERMPEEARLAYEVMERDSVSRNKPHYLPVTIYELLRR